MCSQVIYILSSTPQKTLSSLKHRNCVVYRHLYLQLDSFLCLLLIEKVLDNVCQMNEQQEYKCNSKTVIETVSEKFCLGSLSPTSWESLESLHLCLSPASVMWRSVSSSFIGLLWGKYVMCVKILWNYRATCFSFFNPEPHFSCEWVQASMTEVKNTTFISCHYGKVNPIIWNLKESHDFANFKESKK